MWPGRAGKGAASAVAAALLYLILGGHDGPATEPDLSTFRYLAIDRSGPRDPWGKAVGDMSGNGRPDLIVGGNSGGGLIWYENPHWQKHVIATEGEFSTDHEVADIDGDGRNDVVSITTSALLWFRNPDWAASLIDSQKLHDIEIADLDGDGRLDVVGRASQPLAVAAISSFSTCSERQAAGKSARSRSRTARA